MKKSNGYALQITSGLEQVIFALRLFCYEVDNTVILQELPKRGVK